MSKECLMCYDRDLFNISDRNEHVRNETALLNDFVGPADFGNVHDIRMVDGKWQDIYIGCCSECSGGKASPRPLMRNIANQTGISVAQIIAMCMVKIFTGKNDVHSIEKIITDYGKAHGFEIDKSSQLTKEIGR